MKNKIIIFILVIVGIVIGQQIMSLTISPKADLANIFTVQDKDGNNIFNVDTQNDIVTVSGDMIITKDFEVSGYFWDDLRFPASALSPQNQNAAVPEYDTTNVGWLFDDSQTESITIIAQLPHAWREGSDVEAHVHWEQSADDSVVWQLQYKWANVGGAVPGSWSTVKDSGNSQSYTSGTLHQLTGIGTLDGTGKTLSSVIKMKLSRLGASSGDNHSGDILMTEFDIHYQIDGFGSSLEYTK